MFQVRFSQRKTLKENLFTNDLFKNIPSVKRVPEWKNKIDNNKKINIFCKYSAYSTVAGKLLACQILIILW